MYNKKLFAISLNYMKNHEDAKEACQESWVEIFNSLNAYKEQGNFNAWVKRIVIRVCWKMIRKDKTLEFLDNYTEQISFKEVSNIYDKMECDELLKLLKILPAAAKTVFIMYVVDGFSHAEISEAMGIKVVTSRTHLSRARKLLKEKYFLTNRIARNEL